MRILKPTIITLLLFIAFSASAQRTSIGSYQLTALGTYSFNNFGGEAGFGGYTSLGYWQTRVSGVARNWRFSSGELLKTWRIEAGGGYMFRMYGTRNRIFNLYGGPGAFLGCDRQNDTREFFGEYKSPYEKNVFVYGIDARVELEVFVSDDIAIVGSGRLPVAFGSQLGYFFAEASLGLRFNL